MVLVFYQDQRDDIAADYIKISKIIPLNWRLLSYIQFYKSTANSAGVLQFCQQVQDFVNKGWFWLGSRFLGLKLLGCRERVNHAKTF